MKERMRLKSQCINQIRISGNDRQSRAFRALLRLEIPKMLNDMPPSGPWTGYYLYGHGGLKHPMRLNLSFTRDGKMRGEGNDDVAPFVIDGRFDCATSKAEWTKAYVGMYKVEYSGVYCQRTICGDWRLVPLTGGFWIWPRSFAQTEFGEDQAELEQRLEVVSS
jgi:hypothetical protein